jgi:hypothetical protein
MYKCYAAVFSYVCFRGFDENSSEGSSSPSHSDGSDVDDPELGTRIAELQRDNQLLQVSVYLIRVSGFKMY